MIGQPLFHKDWKVEFHVPNREDALIGEICCVDKNGTFEDPTDVHYDIYCKDTNTVYKHIHQCEVSIPDDVIDGVGEYMVRHNEPAYTSFNGFDVDHAYPGNVSMEYTHMNDKWWEDVSFEDLYDCYIENEEEIKLYTALDSISDDTMIEDLAFLEKKLKDIDNSYSSALKVRIFRMMKYIAAARIMKNG